MHIDEQRTLNIVFKNPNILRSALTRRMQGAHVTDTAETLSNLIKNKLIDSKLQAPKLYKRGRLAQMFFCTKKGFKAILKIRKDYKK